MSLTSSPVGHDSSEESFLVRNLRYDTQCMLVETSGTCCSYTKCFVACCVCCHGTEGVAGSTLIQRLDTLKPNYKVTLRGYPDRQCIARVEHTRRTPNGLLHTLLPTFSRSFYNFVFWQVATTVLTEQPGRCHSGNMDELHARVVTAVVQHSG